MKIVYTNLKEDDFGVVRSVRQLRLDFSKPADSPTTEPERKSSTEGRRRHLSLVSKLAADQRTGIHGEAMDGFTGLACGRSKPITLGTTGSLSAFFINKFIASESLGMTDGSIGSIINISV